jgi:hypothetical protein
VPNKKYKDQSEQVRSFFDSEEFKKANDLDIPLWHGANNSSICRSHHPKETYLFAKETCLDF